MSASIYAGNLQRTGAYRTRGLRTLHGVRWSFQTQGHIYFPPLVAHGMVYVGSNDGCFYALSTHTGALQWRFEMEGAPLSARKDAPIYEWDYTGVTLVQLTESTAFFGTANGTIYGVELETGQLDWQFLGEQGKEFREIFHVIVVDDLLLFWSDSGMSAVNVTTKERLWLEKEVRPIPSLEHLTRCPTIDGQMLYGMAIVGHNRDDVLYAYDLSTNAVVWCNDSCSYFFEIDPEGHSHDAHGVIPVVNGTAYFVGRVPVDDEEEEDLEGISAQDLGGIATFLMAVDALTGKLQWFSYLERCWTEEGYTAIANNLVYVVKATGAIFAIDLATHEVCWTRQLEKGDYDNRYAPPSLADGMLYLPRYNGLITALDALTGQDLWTVQLDGEITTPCTIADGVVYVAASTTVYALH